MNYKSIYKLVVILVITSGACQGQVCDSSTIPRAYFQNTLTECFDDSIHFIDTSQLAQGTIINWQWQFGDGNTSSIQNPANLFLTAGQFEVKLVITTDSGCTDSIIKFLDVYPKPIAEFLTDTTFCLSELSVFTDLSTISNGLINQWNWAFGDGRTFNLSTGYNFYNSDGVYNATLIVISDKGCADTTAQTIHVLALPNLSFDYTDTCLNQVVKFTNNSAINAGGIDSWDWSFGNGLSSTAENPQNTYSLGGGYVITLIAVSDEGCSDTLSKSLTIPATTPVANFSYDSISIQPNVSVEFNNTSTNAMTYEWLINPDLISLFSKNVSQIFSDTGRFEVLLIATDDNGCFAEKKVIIEINLLDQNIPNAFTPNGDGENDILYIRGGPFKELDFLIYNRWGQEVFFSNNQTTGWDGSFKGQEQPLGVYTYIIKSTDIYNNQATSSGDLTLIR